MIINSLLDTDYDKLLLMQLAYYNHRDTQIEYYFKNDTPGIKLPSIINIDALDAELNHICKLKLNSEEIQWINTQGHFTPEFIKYLEDFKLCEYKLSVIDGEFDIRVSGAWTEVMLWESLIPSLINEAYYICKYQNRAQYITLGTQSSFEFISKMIKYPKLSFSDLGTKVRFSGEWQKNIVDILRGISPGISFKGTSNCLIAMKLMIPICTTNTKDINLISDMDMDKWFELYKHDMSIIPCLSTNILDSDYLKLWKGIRQDGEDSVKFIETMLSIYKSLGIDTNSKIIVITENLSADEMIAIYTKFSNQIDILFECGSILTNNVGVGLLNIKLLQHEKN